MLHVVFKYGVLMKDKVTSIRIREDLWKSAKILAIERGITLKALIEELLESAVRGAKLAKKFRQHIEEDALKILRSKRAKEELPFTIVHEKTAVEIVREGRGV